MKFGGYAGATALGVMLGGVFSPSLRHVAARPGLLAVYAAISGFPGALLIGPAMGVASGYNLALAGVAVLLVSADGGGDRRRRRCSAPPAA